MIEIFLFFIFDSFPTPKKDYFLLGHSFLDCYSKILLCPEVASTVLLLTPSSLFDFNPFCPFLLPSLAPSVSDPEEDLVLVFEQFKTIV